MPVRRISSMEAFANRDVKCAIMGAGAAIAILVEKSGVGGGRWAYPAARARAAAGGCESLIDPLLPMLRLGYAEMLRWLGIDAPSMRRIYLPSSSLPRMR